MSTEQNKFEDRRRERVFALLDRLKIQYEIVEHPAMFSAADNELHERDINATIFKNLFLRNKGKSRYYLYSLPIMKRADLAALATRIGETRFSFGNENELWDKLRIRPGSVSPLNVIDASGTDAEILIDQEIFNCGRFGVHPNDNTATVILAPEDLMRILDAAGCRYRIIEVSGYSEDAMKSVTETNRLFLREMTRDDLPATWAIVGDDETMYAWNGAWSERENIGGLEKQLRGYAENGFGRWAVVLKDTGRVIGMRGLMWWDTDKDRVLELGYLFSRAFWQNGYAAEAAIACKRYAFDTLGFDEVFSLIRDNNYASILYTRNQRILDQFLLPCYD
jgi:RimJ/RimL family protein N-acetyltransferase